MPVYMDQAAVPHRLHLSNRALVLCWTCFLATFFGASAITLSLSFVLQAHAVFPAYWAYWWIAAALLVIWFATLINMYRLTIAAILVDR
jgi:amino acid transporter